MSDEALHYRSLSSIADEIRARSISPVELTEALLARIDALDSTLLSYATVMADQALDDARRAEQEIVSGNYRGPLHGVPIALKDLCYTAGTRTMGGARVYRDFVPTFDATVVRRLRDAGAVILGKLNLTEGALSGYHRDFPIPVNPWHADLWTGVSSSGSGVATAAGLCFAAISTDTGGSIRYPSMANGVVGLKPTYGRVSRYGVLELAASLDHVGPMARTVKDAAILFEAIAGFDERDATALNEPLPRILEALSDDLGGLRIGLDERYLSEGTDTGLVEAIHSAVEVLAEKGAQIVEVSMPKLVPMELRSAWLPICAFEAAQAHSASYPSRADDYGGYLGDALRMGASMTAADYTSAMELRASIVAQFDASMAGVDAVICPSGGSVFSVEKAVQYGDMEALKPVIQRFQGQFTIPADLAGTPTITVPCGFSAEGHPYTLQLLGNRLSELALCRIAHAYECASPWHKQHPTIVI